MAGQGDGLEVPVGLAKVVFGLAVLHERLQAFFAFRHGYRVHEHGRIAFNRAVRLEFLALLGADHAHARGEKLRMHALGPQRLADGFHRGAAHAVRDEQGHTAPLERLLARGVKAQGRVFVEAAHGFGQFAGTLLLGEGDAELVGHGLGQFGINAGQQVHDALADVGAHHLGEFEGEGVDDVLLLGLGLAQPEEPGMREVVGEGGAALADLLALDHAGIGGEAAVFRSRGDFAGPVAADGVGLVVGRGDVDLHPVEAVALMVADRRDGLVDRDFGEIGPTQTVALRVHVGEDAALQERIVRKVDAGHDVGRAEGHLFGFRKEVVGIAVKDHLADDFHRHEGLGDDFGGVEDVETELVLVLFGDDLEAELEFRIVARLNALPQVLAVEIGVASGQFLRLVPDERGGAVDGLPVEAHEAAFAFGVHEAVGMDAEALDGAVASRDAPVGHVPHDVVQGFRLEGDEIPKGIVRALALRHFVVRLGFDRVDQIGEFDGVLNEEDRGIVAHEVEIALARRDFRGEAADVAYRVRRPPEALYIGKTHKDRGFDLGVL